MDEKIERRVSGFSIKGKWEDVVELGERITAALEYLDIDDEKIKEWEEWRPKLDEKLDDDISEKTSDKASIGKSKGEQEGKSAGKDMQTAGEKLEQTYEKLGDEKSSDEALSEVQESFDYTKRAAETASRKVIRKFESTVYEHLMTQVSPYYFDTELISANISEVSTRFSDQPVYKFEVNINDDELKQKVEELLDEWEDEIERWHLESPKSTETQENADGVSTNNSDISPSENLNHQNKFE